MLWYQFGCERVLRDAGFSFLLYVVCSSRRRHTRCALVTGVQTCALPILEREPGERREGAPGLCFGKARQSARPADAALAPQKPLREVGDAFQLREIGRASCRDRVCQYV